MEPISKSLYFMYRSSKKKKTLIDAFLKSECKKVSRNILLGNPISMSGIVYIIIDWLIQIKQIKQIVSTYVHLPRATFTSRDFRLQSGMWHATHACVAQYMHS